MSRNVHIERTIPKDQRQGGGGRGGPSGGSRGDPDSSCVFVGNLPFGVDEQTMMDFFDSCGEIKHVRIAKDPEGNPKGFAHVEFVQSDSAKRAVNSKNGQSLDGRNVKVDFSSSRKPGEGGGRGRGGDRGGGFRGGFGGGGRDRGGDSRGGGYGGRNGGGGRDRYGDRYQTL
eukprot:TRINITY_DN333_c0_g1_i1.p3 TRINITY_DN333_c0_g1~~TRINITY_DN333_c0_g1_i1.p3  ORF type:complete len:172 (-),score=61.24 TRINITY_DN333_c0_g1_i1:392-907(-)